VLSFPECIGNTILRVTSVFHIRISKDYNNLHIASRGREENPVHYEPTDVAQMIYTILCATFHHHPPATVLIAANYYYIQAQNWKSGTRRKSHCYVTA
jgi:hypothetical protein